MLSNWKTTLLNKRGQKLNIVISVLMRDKCLKHCPYLVLMNIAFTDVHAVCKLFISTNRFWRFVILSWLFMPSGNTESPPYLLPVLTTKFVPSWKDNLLYSSLHTVLLMSYLQRPLSGIVIFLVFLQLVTHL